MKLWSVAVLAAINVLIVWAGHEVCRVDAKSDLHARSRESSADGRLLLIPSSKSSP